MRHMDMAGVETRERCSSCAFLSAGLSMLRELFDVDETDECDGDVIVGEEDEGEDDEVEEHGDKGNGDMAEESTDVIGAPSSRKKLDDHGVEVLKRDPHRIRKSTKVRKSRVRVRRELRTAGRLCRCSDPGNWGPIFLLF
ncbi:hypothetical protein ElyMa_005172400 [Elysia marginata]|uniref:Uncharacterized protein n=1 Tax=Elysia marginata TaxID=1093978 RepID=A0AAV4JQH4_9GAST|nr:hypothetical protein ElyMa_005172400 [Elysia marginata]